MRELGWRGPRAFLGGGSLTPALSSSPGLPTFPLLGWQGQDVEGIRVTVTGGVPTSTVTLGKRVPQPAAGGLLASPFWFPGSVLQDWGLPCWRVSHV